MMQPMCRSNQPVHVISTSDRQCCSNAQMEGREPSPDTAEDSDQEGPPDDEPAAAAAAQAPAAAARAGAASSNTFGLPSCVMM